MSNETKKKSLVAKIATLRAEISKREIKKSGKNKYAGFNYFELSDMLPVCNELCEKLNIVAMFSFLETEAELIIYDGDSEKTVRITITTNIDDISARMGADKQSRGMQPVQRLGSVNTYCKRYLYVNFLDLVESDAIDGMEQPKELATKDQIKKIVDYCNKNSKFIEYMDTQVGHKKANELTGGQADFLLNAIELKEKNRKPVAEIINQNEPQEDINLDSL